MIFKSTIPAIVASFALAGAGAALAEEAPNTASTYGAGGATANSEGVTAGGMTAGNATAESARTKGAERRADRLDRRKSNRDAAPTANSASTYGTGVVSTTRDSANAGVTTGASASGSGRQSAGSTVDAYGETTRDGSNADIYGDSGAVSGDKVQ